MLKQVAIEAISVLILALPTILEIYEDWKEYRKKKKDKKTEDVIIRGTLMLAFSIVISIMNPARPLIDSFLLSVGIFVMFFDPTMGWLLTKRLDFLGTTSKTDENLKKWPKWALWTARGIFFVGSVLLYYIN